MASAGSYDDFFNALRVRESGNDYSVVNAFGFLGAYQFGEAALVDLGFVSNDGNAFDNDFNGTFTGRYDVFDVVDFLSSASAQDLAAADWFNLLWNRIRFLDLEIYDGQTLNGVTLTKTGMIAGAHLGGVGSIDDFIESGGFSVPADAFGTTIVDYIELFEGYETPSSFVNNLDKDNQIFGGDGPDRLVGEGGNDTLFGGGDADWLDGGAGDDLLYGDGGEALVLMTPPLG